MIPIALQLYTVREDLVEDPVRTIEAVAEIGYQGVEGGTPTGMSNKDYLSLLNDNNLTLVGSGTSTAGLAASIFHNNEIHIQDLKRYLKTKQIPVRCK